MDDDVSRTFKYAADFYLSRVGIIVIFSLPFILAFLIPALVPAPTYVSLGGVFIRTGSLPEFSPADIIWIGVAYAASLFVIADTIVNINIVVRSKRTLTTIKHEVVSAFGTYAARIFALYTGILLLLFAVQVLTYESQLRSVIYPLVGFVASFLLFFVPPAVVIDNADLPKAVGLSARMAIRNPHYVLLWAFLMLFILSLLTVIGNFLFVSPFSGYFVLLVNSLVVLPYFTVLQTQMYMEKYPLAR